MFEAEDRPIGLAFNGSLRLEGRPERVTFYAGAIVLRETAGRSSDGSLARVPTTRAGTEWLVLTA